MHFVWINDKDILRILMAVAAANVAIINAVKSTEFRGGSNLGRNRKKVGARPPPLFISTNPYHINPQHLSDLYASSNLSCHRFPVIGPDGSVEPVDLRKLRIALSHSSAVVSVFCKPDDIPTSSSSSLPSSLFRLETVLPVTHSNGQLVGFGRAVSDNALTASIYDVMVIPSLRRMGVGKMIVKRIVRMLTSRDIYDIAALCSENERLFFKACGFGDDILGSTTMMYTRTGSNYTTGDQMITRAGRSLLLVPSCREPFTCLNTE